jgi:predicted RNA-binding Zn-ribbon protein involved in translation (DUF1610 family)
MELFTEEQSKAVITALESKAKDVCPICGQNQMSVVHGIAMIPVFGPPFLFLKPDILLPSIAIVCINCGFTGLYNIHALGVAEILGFPKGGEPINPIKEVKNG